MLIDDVASLAKTRGVVHAADLERIGASRTLLPYLARKGILRRIACGAYLLADHIPEQEAFLEIAVAVPHGIVCLLSALQFHELTTQNPPQAWVAVEQGKYVPTSKRIPLRIVKFSGPAFAEGIEEHQTDGVVLRVYSPAKTVVDCFRFRNRIGLDVAREALVDCLEQKKATKNEIWQFAQRCRMANVMRPYLEMA